MSLRLISELQTRVDRWFDTMMDDAARLRFYQRHLLELRQFSPRPRCSVALTLRQCVAARKMQHQAAAVLAENRRRIDGLITPSATHPH